MHHWLANCQSMMDNRARGGSEGEGGRVASRWSKQWRNKSTVATEPVASLVHYNDGWSIAEILKRDCEQVETAENKRQQVYFHLSGRPFYWSSLQPHSKTKRQQNNADSHFSSGPVRWPLRGFLCCTRFDAAARHLRECQGLIWLWNSHLGGVFSLFSAA